MGDSTREDAEPSRGDRFTRSLRTHVDGAAPWLIDRADLEELARLMPDLSTALIAQIMGVEVASTAVDAQHSAPARG
ncbi:hypothetical protein ACFORH_39205 [Amycolatopsis roodepoortensis]|uniref:Uncharacterized protein Yka (UPF0111/DUF47 family) n=1 Tax=Amycolatopsis roodepoortensis TaxID=700274 RepID=A0ABR9LIM4_9PSEU|nr:hypothetical protein [Amycolatopsis roodepoortensis]MBE1580546.1 uncharacterized protein Yka (UPF0111/DUF47 family) [Amycolatopsis roodepoortensis]